MKQVEPKPFTGRHMLVIMLSFFGVIIGVNLMMAYAANTSWTGFVVQNSYVASQQFNEKMAETRAQDALGWTGTLTFVEGRPQYSLRDKTGHPVAVRATKMKTMRPVDDREDSIVELSRSDDGSFIADRPIADGVWLVEIEAEVGREKPYRQLLRVKLVDGAMQ